MGISFIVQHFLKIILKSHPLKWNTGWSIWISCESSEHISRWYVYCPTIDPTPQGAWLSGASPVLPILDFPICKMKKGKPLQPTWENRERRAVQSRTTPSKRWAIFVLMTTQRTPFFIFSLHYDPASHYWAYTLRKPEFKKTQVP